MANLSSTRIFGDGTVERSLYVKQRLGVGIGNPNHGLHVVSDENQPAEIESPSGSTWLDLTSNDGRKWSVGSSRTGKFQVYDRNQNEYFVSLQSNGYFGLGRDVRNPNTNLDIQSDSGYTSIRMKAGSDSGMSIGVDSDDGDKFKLGDSWDPTSGTHLTVDQGGNVGIGTTSPSDTLEVRGPVTIDEGSSNTRLKINSPSGEFSYIRFSAGGTDKWDVRKDPADDFEFNDRANGNTTTLRLKQGGDVHIPAGKVGIGTNNPNVKLDVEGAADLNGRLNMRGNDINDVRRINGDNGNHRIRFTSNNSYIEFTDQSNNRRQIVTEDTYINEDGVWLGDHVSNDDAHHPDHRDGVDFIDFDNDERSDHDGQDGRLFWDLSEGLYISSSNSRTGNTSVLQWSRSNVNPGSNISISYDGRGRPTISASSGNTYTDSDARDAILNNTLGLGEGFRFHDDTSNLNTGTLPGNDYRVLRIEDGNSPNSPDGAFVLTSGDDDAIIQEWFDVGTEIHTDLYVRQDVIAFYSSDRRLKKNPTQVEKPMTKIEKLTGVGFGWKEKASREGKGFGIFAQDAKKIDDRLIRKQGNGYLGVDYQQLHGIEIEALKQVNENVNQNQSRIQKLEDKVEQLQNKINQIKQ
jgi:hypothetical protein